MSVKQRFPDHSSNELEEIQMVWIDKALRVRVVSDTVGGQVEQTVVGVEHGSWKLNEEVSSKTASVVSSFTGKVDM